MNTTRKLLATALALSLGATAPAFAGYTVWACNAWGCAYEYVPTCSWYGCF